MAKKNTTKQLPGADTNANENAKVDTNANENAGDNTNANENAKVDTNENAGADTNANENAKADTNANKNAKKDAEVGDVFKAYPYAEKVYETSDNSKFIQFSYAEAHAATLANKNIVTYSRNRKSNE